MYWSTSADDIMHAQPFCTCWILFHVVFQGRSVTNLDGLCWLVDMPCQLAVAGQDVKGPCVAKPAAGESQPEILLSGWQASS